MSDTADLHNKGILITRAAAQAEILKATVEARGGKPYVFPVLEISYAPKAQIQAWLLDIKSEDILIFVSMNAVYAVSNSIEPALHRQLSGTQIAAVGARTAKALREAGLEVSIQSSYDQQTSEGLLQHPALQSLNGRRVFIVRAQSGRDTLKQLLRQRGASVQHIQAYTRGMPQHYDAQTILKSMVDRAIHVVLLTSHDAFLNLMQMLGETAQDLLREVVLIVPSQRVADMILAVYPFKVSVAANASDEAMLVQAAEA